MRRLTVAAYLLLVVSFSAVAQTAEEGKRWLAEMKRTGVRHLAIDSLAANWLQKGPGYAARALQQTQAAAGKGDKGTAIALLIAGSRVRSGTTGVATPATSRMADSAYRLATQWNNEDLLIAAAYNAGKHHLYNGNTDEGLFCLLKAIALAEAKGYNRTFVSLSKLMATSHLYQTHNYKACIEIGRSLLQDLDLYPARERLGVYNNLGLCYRATGKYDSAIAFFGKARTAAVQAGDNVWVGIATGNTGDVLRLQGRAKEAIPYWQADIDSSLKYNEGSNAGLSMIWVSEELFRQGQQAKARALLRRADSLIGTNQSNRLAFFEVAGNLAQQAGNYRDALLAWQRFSNIRDSLNAQANRNDYVQLKLKLDYESTATQYHELAHRRQTELLWRNFLLVILLLVLVVAWVVYSRQRLNYRMAQQAKQLAEAENKAAAEQLALFTQTVLEKNRQIEQLTSAVRNLQQTNEDQLVHVSILTDEDWVRFKKLFEKAHPGFFERLLQLAPDTMQAEMRLAALMKLKLDSKAMASMQGISLGGLRSNRLRLRQRLQPHAADGIEAFVQNL